MAENSISKLIEAEIESGELELPLFNRTALRLQQVKESDSVTIDEITRLIMEDQALATRLLKVANSSFFGGLKQIDTVSGAVIRLGTRRVADMALLASQAANHQSNTPMLQERFPGLWVRSYLAATGCQWLAERCGLGVEPETAFLAGLLHDVGELYLYKVIEMLLADGTLTETITPALLDDIIGALHARVGSEVMSKAGLPDKYARVALDHDGEDFDPADTLVALCRLLDNACFKLGLTGGEPQPDFVLAATHEAQALGISEIKLAQLEVYLDDAIEQARQTADLMAA